MSSTAPQLRSRLPRLAPQLAQAAVQRARLTLVPRPSTRPRAPRVPFVTLISVVLLAGVVGLLLFNTSMQQASFRATALERQASDLSARQEALEMELQQLRDPQRVAARAQRMGLVIPSGPAGVLHLKSGKVDGDPKPATTGDKLPIDPPAPKKPAALDPKPVKVGARDADRNTAGNGAATREQQAQEGRNGARRR